MELLHLPPDWASFLNELAFFEQPSDELFVRALGDVRAWHTFESGFWVNEEDRRDLDSLAVVLSELEKKHDSLDFVAPRCFEMVKLMDSIRARRERASYSLHPVLNDLGLAVAATLAGQAEDRAVRERLPRVRAWRDELWACRTDHEDLLRGFELFDRALGELPSREALVTLLQSAEILQVLVDWRRRWLEDLSREYTRWPIPEVGPRLERAWEEMPSAEVWESRSAPLWTELAYWWGQNRELLPLPAEFLVSWMAQVDEDLDALVSLDVSEGLDLAELEGWVDALAADFAAASRLMRPTEHLRGGQGGYYFELIQGLLRNTLPVVVVPELLRESPPPEGWRPVVEGIAEYVRGGPRELLYEARMRLLDLVPDGVGWYCPFCSAANGLDAERCASCGEVNAVVVEG